MDSARTQKVKQYVVSLTQYTHFTQQDIITQAFVHKSYAMDFTHDIPYNERLEFLGDAVLDTIIAKELFDNFPHEPESQLTLYKIALVREETLALVAKEIELGKYILISKGENKSQGREKASILSDCLEALIGALFIEGGYELAKRFVLQYIYKHIHNIDQLMPVKSYKAQVQEFAQGRYKELPVYVDTPHQTESSGNITEFKSELRIQKEKVSEGFGTNKKKAQENAACIFIQSIQS